MTNGNKCQRCGETHTVADDCQMFELRISPQDGGRVLMLFDNQSLEMSAYAAFRFGTALREAATEARNAAEFLTATGKHSTN